MWNPVLKHFFKRNLLLRCQTPEGHVWFNVISLSLMCFFFQLLQGLKTPPAKEPYWANAEWAWNIPSLMHISILGMPGPPETCQWPISLPGPSFNRIFHMLQPRLSSPKMQHFKHWNRSVSSLSTSELCHTEPAVSQQPPWVAQLAICICFFNYNFVYLSGLCSKEWSEKHAQLQLHYGNGLSDHRLHLQQRSQRVTQTHNWLITDIQQGFLFATVQVSHQVGVTMWPTVKKGSQPQHEMH